MHLAINSILTAVNQERAHGISSSYSAIMNHLGMGVDPNKVEFLQVDNANRARFMILVELHQKAFTVRPEDNVWEMAEEAYRFHPWLYNKSSAYLLASLKLVQERGVDNWEDIFYFSTPLTERFAEMSIGDHVTAKELGEITQYHISEEASEVIKEICKNQRNQRITSVNYVKELADLQAMLDLAKGFLSDAERDELRKQTGLMRNKKMVVISEELKERSQ